MKRAALACGLTFVMNCIPANATELKFWPGKRLHVGEQVLCVQITAEQQFHGGFGNVLLMRFDSSVEGSVSLNGGTIAQFKYEKGQVSETEINLTGSSSELANGKLVQLGISVEKPVTVVKDGLRMNTINTSRIVACPAR